MVRPGPAGGGRHPRPRHGRRRGGRIGSPRDRDEPRPRRLPSLPAVPEARPDRPALARAGQVRALLRALQPHPLHPAVPVGLPDDAGRPEVVAQVGQPHPGAPRVRAHGRRGDDHRAARAGHRERGGHGGGGPPRARPLRPRRAAGRVPFDHTVWAFASDGDIEEGISHEASALAAHQRLGNLVLLYDDNHISIEDDTAIALSEDVRAATRRTAGTSTTSTGPRTATTRRTSPRCGRLRRGEGGDVAPVLHRAAHDHRLAGAEQEEHREDPRLGARRRRGRRDQADPRHGPGGELPRPRGRAGARPRSERPGPREPRRVEQDVRGVARREPRAGRRVRPDLVPHPPRRLGRGAADVRARQGPRDPRGVRRGAGGAGAGPAGAVGRLGRPRGEQQHDDEGRAVLHPRGVPDQGVPRPPLRPDAALRRPGARDGRDLQRHRAARRHPPVRRHVPDLQRLHAPGGPARGADEAAGHLRLDARLDRPRRGRPDAPARRAPVGAAGDPRAGRRPAGGRQRDGGGVADRPAAHRPPGGPRADPAEAADAGPRGRPRVRGGSPGAGTCWRTPRAAAPT